MIHEELRPPEPTGDELIDEIRAYRFAISAEYGHDIQRLAEALREMERKRPERVITVEQSIAKSGKQGDELRAAG
jgi:hypothetical protein